MSAELIRKKELLSKQKMKLEEKEKRLKLKERQQRVKALIHLGELCVKAGISDLPEDKLVGAFLQIASERNSHEAIARWKKLNNEMFNSSKEKARLLLSFPTPPSTEHKNSLKDLGFKFNSWRDEWYGVGNEKFVLERLNGSGVKIEIARAP